MYVHFVLLVTTFLVCAFLLFALATNEKQVRKILYYQYKYIPEPLISLVEVINLKPS
ncbi:LdOrf-106 peptide [Lymantria dispar multiple nucleopolyhedrovirus]|jgi:hypothetical protein|uniref:Ac110 n=1 Tax=Lymantria dispar multicapsid nuclear polyhedrosis virus TaxID=10449 RepID=Q9YMM1_NPVLD|nr:LdOrf-106 peptide [Lymantria dispar multiple nucleopolyhedrovirus]AAC70292.1 LdOrf-106 peptide [Lymantria dispar multiple nucleopolyhedrovirus]AHC69607.1 ORF-106 protein [Lymantria dispar multiple nucleopolyhedrovirus]AIX47945.1 hypothetical protein [Lymantria dispar multiple nucleopolyhedrovirus]AJR20379.1 orf-103 protein [Lymantria dispar multiple nucleopolyhedrovirus]AMO27602.1 hypothetical protein [Lymantria dispar multiple nucleopolyhedrovirus]